MLLPLRNLRLLLLASILLALPPAARVRGQGGVSISVLVAERVWKPTCQSASETLAAACAAEEAGGAGCSGGCQGQLDMVWAECAGTVGKDQVDEWDTEVRPRLEVQLAGWGCRPGSKSAATAAATGSAGLLLFGVVAAAASFAGQSVPS
eukprot:SAG22_NODE_1190_length_5206_cov_1.878990_2_plen_150_part_00